MSRHRHTTTVTVVTESQAGGAGVGTLAVGLVGLVVGAVLIGSALTALATLALVVLAACSLLLVLGGAGFCLHRALAPSMSTTPLRRAVPVEVAAFRLDEARAPIVGDRFAAIDVDGRQVDPLAIRPTTERATR